MKSTFPAGRTAILCAYGLSLVTLLAQGGPPQVPQNPEPMPGRAGLHNVPMMAPPPVDPYTGLSAGQYSRLLTADPNTGIPTHPDPDLLLTNIAYNEMPLGEVVSDLRKRFKDSVDILPLALDFDWGAPVSLQLKNVRARELFDAMNLVFENDRTPFRWEYGLNGSRFTAIVHMLPRPADPGQLRPPEMPQPPKRPMVFFVGTLISDDKPGGASMEALAKTLSEICRMAYDDEVTLNFHNEAQIMVVKGTEEQIGFIRETLNVLIRKEQERKRNAAVNARETK